MGWSVPSFTHWIRVQLRGTSTAPFVVRGGSSQDACHPLHQLSIHWGVFVGKAKPMSCFGNIHGMGGTIHDGGKGVPGPGWAGFYSCLGPLGVSTQRMQQLGNPVA